MERNCKKFIDAFVVELSDEDEFPVEETPKQKSKSKGKTPVKKVTPVKLQLSTGKGSREQFKEDFGIEKPKKKGKKAALLNKIKLCIDREVNKARDALLEEMGTIIAED